MSDKKFSVPGGGSLDVTLRRRPKPLPARRPVSRDHNGLIQPDDDGPRYVFRRKKRHGPHDFGGDRFGWYLGSCQLEGADPRLNGEGYGVYDPATPHITGEIVVTLTATDPIVVGEGIHAVIEAQTFRLTVTAYERPGFDGVAVDVAAGVPVADVMALRWPGPGYTWHAFPGFDLTIFNNPVEFDYPPGFGDGDGALGTALPAGDGS